VAGSIVGNLKLVDPTLNTADNRHGLIGDLSPGAWGRINSFIRASAEKLEML
jgi:hypothetical protein